MSGDLTLMGVTRAVALEVESNGLAASPDGHTRFGLSAAGELRRSDFGIMPIGLDRAKSHSSWTCNLCSR